MIGRCLILATMMLAAGSAQAAPKKRAPRAVPAPQVAPVPQAATKVLSAVCTPDDESVRFVQPDIAGVSWLVTVDPIPQPPKVRIEAKDARPLRLIEGPAERYYQGPNGTWILESVLLDPTLGPRPGQQVVYNYMLTLRESPLGVDIDSGVVRYRLGPTDIMTTFKFACRRPVPAKKASSATMTAHPAGGEG